MAYSTTAAIRQEAGFTNNSNILDALITTHQTAATAIINSHVSAVYDIASFTGSNWTGSDGANFLKKTEELLAAGFLMLAEYGLQEEGDTKNGQIKVDQAIQWLTNIKNGDMKLLGVDKSELPKTGLNARLAPASAISSSTAENQDGEAMNRRFSIGMDF